MPFLFEEGLLFARSDAVIELQYLSDEQIYDLAETNPELREQLAQSGMTREKTLSYRAWKTHLLDSAGMIRRIETGFNAGEVECSSSLYRKNDLYHLNLVCGIPAGEIFTYHLYQMSGHSLDALSAPRKMAAEQLSLGFINPDLIAIKDNPDFDPCFYVLDRRTNQSWRCEIPDHFVYRLSFVANQPRVLVVTLLDFDRNPHSYLVDFDTAVSRELRHGVDPIYKCSYLDGRIISAFRQSAEVEDLVLEDAGWMAELLEKPLGFTKQQISRQAAFDEILNNLEVTGG